MVGQGQAAVTEQQQQTYEVTAPDGKVLEVTGPAGASHDEVIRQAQALYKPQTNTGPAPDARTPSEVLRDTLLHPIDELSKPGVLSEGISALGRAILNPTEGQNVKTGMDRPENALLGASATGGAATEGLSLSDALKSGPLARLFAGAGTKTTADDLMAKAAANRIAAQSAPTPDIPTSTAGAVKSGIRAALAPIRNARANVQETLARIATANDIPLVPNVPTPEAFEIPAVKTPVMNATGAEATRTTSAYAGGRAAPIPEIPNNPPVSQVPATPPASSDLVSVPYPRSIVNERLLQEGRESMVPDWYQGVDTKVPVTIPSEPLAFSGELGPATPRPSSLDAPTINKWMNVPAKEVMNGANPGQQLLDEKLIGATKEATKANVKAALADAGQQMQSKLEAATGSGVTIDAQTPVYDAVSQATKRIGSPRDAAFQAQMNGIVDDIESKYPDLSRLTPSDTHALKVEVGDAIQWSGAGYDTPANQALVRIYRDLNGAIKGNVPGIADVQSRWGSLYVANKNLSGSLARDLVGRGTGAIPPVIPKP